MMSVNRAVNHSVLCHTIKPSHPLTSWFIPVITWPLPVAPFLVCGDVFKQQYSLCMKVGSGGNLGLSRESSNKLFGPMFYV